MDRTIIIGSRGSELALWQANHIRNQLEQKGLRSEIRIIKTQGDRIQDMSFDKLEGKGFFTKELEDALLANAIDLAVHSHKDLPTTSPEGLIIAAVSEREDPSELLLIRKTSTDISKLFSLKENARVGTSSARRKAQFLSFRPDVTLSDLRGNVPTRINKLREGMYDAILLAKAGIARLNPDLSDLHVETLDPREFIPAPAQGVLALQIRSSDSELISALQLLHHPEVAAEIEVERKVLNLFEGGCHLPLGVYCRKGSGQFNIWAAKADMPDGVPKRIYVKTDRTEEIPEQIVYMLNRQTPQRIFISRDLDKNNFLYRTLTGHGYEVNGISLISTKPVPFSEIPHTDWIFFSSKHGVQHFFSGKPEPAPGIRFGVTGKGTERMLRSFGKTADFIGDDPEPSETGKKFIRFTSGQSVLFVNAEESLRTIQQEFPATAKIQELIVYRTDLNPQTIAYADILVFTSPSNVRAFLMKNTTSLEQKIIAIGNSTARELEMNGIRSYITSHGPEETALAETIFSLA